jgi:cysteine-rich repeat protein
MIRNSAKFTALAVATLLGSVATVNCSKSSNSNGPVGHVNLALSLASGAKVNSVHYKIHAGTPTGIADVEGDINTSDVNATASAYHSFPASMGDVVTLSATTTAGVACNGSSMPFSVTANNVAAVDVTLVCGGSTPTQTGGSIAINGTVVEGDNCPLLTSWAASPLQTSLGGTIDVSGAATDSDIPTIPGEALSYKWTSAGGTFADSTALSTKFTCTVSGPQTITLTVTDNHVPTSCPTSVQIPVTCVGGTVCGNGVVESGEDCEGNGTYTAGVGICNGATCHYLAPVCGNSKIELGESCDDGNTANGDGCSSTCQTMALPAVCGNGVVETGEDCDPPNGTTCSATCKTIVPMATACQTCEISATTAGTCFQTSSTANAGTTDFTKFGCNGFSGAALTACNDLIGCMRTNHCGAGDDPTPCLCGALSAATCATTPAASLPGVCAPKYITAAAGGDVFGLFFSTDSPIGVANNLYTCDVDAPCTCP